MRLKNTNCLYARIMLAMFGNRRLQSAGFINRTSASCQVSAEYQYRYGNKYVRHQKSDFLLTFHVEVLVVVPRPQVCVLDEEVALSLLLHVAFSGLL